MRQSGDGPTLIELVSAARPGDRRSWAELMARYNAAVWSVVVSFRSQAADADDVVQDTWLRALERLDTSGSRSGSGVAAGGRPERVPGAAVDVRPRQRVAARRRPDGGGELAAVRGQQPGRRQVQPAHLDPADRVEPLLDERGRRPAPDAPS